MSGETTVTEAEWLACTDPQKMLEFVRGKVSDRKLRLFAVACCRRIWHFLDDDRCRNAAEVAERYVEGRCTPLELAAVHDAAVDAIGEVWGRLSELEADVNGLPAAKLNAMRAAGFAAREHPEPFGAEEGFEGSHTYAVFALSASHGAVDAIEYSEGRWQADVIRDFVGNPFRPVSVNPSWLAWNDATIVRLAQAAYEERHMPAGTLDNGRLAVLADALEEAGCSNPDILNHCRQPGEHVRGCWVVDLLLGKK